MARGESTYRVVETAAGLHDPIDGVVAWTGALSEGLETRHLRVMLDASPRR